MMVNITQKTKMQVRYTIPFLVGLFLLFYIVYNLTDPLFYVETDKEVLLWKGMLVGMMSFVCFFNLYDSYKQWVKFRDIYIRSGM